MSSAAKRYARALYEIGEERRSLEQITSEVEALATTWSGARELRQILENPLFPMQKRREILTTILDRLGVGEMVRNAARLLHDRGRLRIVPEVARSLRALADDREGKIRAEVVTATPLPDQYFERLRVRLEAITGRRVVLDRRHDPSLIAGLVARVGDRLYDGSARTRLAEIRESMMET